MNHADLKNRFLNLLARRDYSHHELRQKAQQWARQGKCELQEALQVLDQLREEGWQSDERALAAMVRHQTQRHQGSRKIEHHLQQKGFSRDAIREALQDWDSAAALSALYARKFSAAPADIKERQKRIRFLVQRGFHYQEIEALLRALQH